MAMCTQVFDVVIGISKISMWVVNHWTFDTVCPLFAIL